MFVSLATPFEMLQKDITAVKEYGLPEELLMENAGREAFSVLQKQFSSFINSMVFVFAGSGNNAGDGIVLGRYLKESGAHVLVILEKKPESLSKVTHWHYQVAKRYGLQFCSVDEFYADIAFSVTPDIIVDALLGIGFIATVKENLQERIRYINSFAKKACIFSLDIPSGLHCFTGKPNPIAVKASLTATFHIPKVGLYMPPAKEYTGDIHICNIGIPEQNQQNKYQVLLYPPHKNTVKQDLHKHSAGRVLIIGGSEEYIGAPLLSANATIRMGAGSVTIATLQSVAESLKSIAYEHIIMSLPFTKWNAVVFNAIHPILYKYDTIIVGPGMGSYIGVKDFVFAMLQNKKRPFTVFDADAVRSIPLMDNNIRSFLQETDILTPHIGELSQMLVTSTDNIKNNKLDVAHICKNQSSAVVIIKDAGTIIVQKNQPITISPFLAPNLAVAGSGDILAGMIAGETLKRKDSFLAACSAVYYHAKIGEALKEEFPFRGNTPNDIIQYINPILKKIYV